MELRKGTLADRESVEGLYEEARAFLRSMGTNQWQDGYPNGESFLQDVKAGSAWVLEEDGKVVGTACLAFGREPTYDTIYQGAWGIQPEEYAFLHRVAVSGACKGKGGASLFFKELERQARERGLPALRGDTHRDNKVMQRVMEKNGLTYRGIIYLEDGDERLAFERLL